MFRLVVLPCFDLGLTVHMHVDCPLSTSTQMRSRLATTRDSRDAAVVTITMLSFWDSAVDAAQSMLR